MNAYNRIMLSLLFFALEISTDPLLVVLLMVKNEACVIAETLQPFVDGGVKDFLLFDTGSNDGTQDIAREFFKKNNIPNSIIVEEPFINFSASRNRALEHAQSRFPEATFMIMPDAEWYMHNTEKLLAFCQDHKNDSHNSYFIPIRNTTAAFVVSRLIRCRRNVRFVGAVHETLNQLTYVTLPQDIYFEWRPAQQGIEKSKKRWERDRDLLLHEYEKNPHDPRTLFYLGQTYDCLGDWENAYTFYTKRAALRGWDEENFMTQFRLGTVAEKRSAKNDSNAICPITISHYLQAYSLRPSRAEPLIKLAHYFLQKNNMHLAYLFAVRAVQIPYPEKDWLFIEKYMYDFTRYDILGRCAWYVQDYERGEWAVRKALEINPNAWHLQCNLSLYTDRKKPLPSGST